MPYRIQACARRKAIEREEGKDIMLKGTRIIQGREATVFRGIVDSLRRSVH